MATSPYTRSLVGSVKRLKLSATTTPATQCQVRQIQRSSRSAASASVATGLETSTFPSLEAELAGLRLPKAVQATYLNPMKPDGKKRGENNVCELHLHSYSVRNLEMFSDFACRAAYFLKLRATGPGPLPRKTERWTVPRSNFVHKKSQENFERITMKRKITVTDSHPDAVAVWLAFLRKHQYYGVGMKANVYEHGSLDAAKGMDREGSRLGQELLDQQMLAQKGSISSDDFLHENFKAQWGGYAAMGGTPGAPHATTRLPVHKMVPGSEREEAEMERVAREQRKQEKTEEREERHEMKRLAREQRKQEKTKKREKRLEMEQTGEIKSSDSGDKGGIMSTPRRIYVSNLPSQVSRQQIRDLFCQAGDIASLNPFHGKGIAIVKFANAKDAEAAVEQFNGHNWEGHVLEVTETPFAIAQMDSGPSTLHKVRVSNLPPQVSWQDLKDLLVQAGGLARADIDNPKTGNPNHTGMAKFTTLEEAQKAVAKFNGHEWKGSVIKLEHEE